MRIEVGDKVQLRKISFSHALSIGQGRSKPEIIDSMKLHTVTESELHEFHIDGHYYDDIDVKALFTKEEYPEYYL